MEDLVRQVRQGVRLVGELMGPSFMTFRREHGCCGLGAIGTDDAVAPAPTCGSGSA